MHEKPHVLIVDDDAAIRKLVGRAAQSAEFDCHFLSGASGFEAALDGNVAAVVLDLQLPSADGVELLRMMARVDSRIPVILISGVDSRVLATAVEVGRAHGLRVLGSLQKPFAVGALVSMLRDAADSNGSVPRSARTPQVLSASEIATAVNGGALLLHYQPKIDVASRKVVGAEGLVRLQQPGGPLAFPDSFIPIAEREGLIDDIGWRVFRQAIPACRRLRETFGDFHVSVNVSARSLQDVEMPDRVAVMLDDEGLPPSALTLEITESGLIENVSATLDILTRFRLKGLNLSIDDFGTGFAMMQQLRRVPATEIKIDKSFVQEARREVSAEIVVRKTIEIGHELGMHVVGEGVESSSELRLLEDHGCDAAQGYFFSRPVPEAELVSWMSRYHADASMPS